MKIGDCQIPQRSVGEDAAARAPMVAVCEEPRFDPAAQAALQLVCRDARVSRDDSSTETTIIVGFVGGFANPHDQKHPEVLFAEYLREHYAGAVLADVFSNHDEAGALRFVMRALTGDSSGPFAVDKRKNARIILYGHSWGASEAVAFARQLGRQGIPVQLTIQMDIVVKPGQNPLLIPDNVHSAVNFYQPRGVLHGRRTIFASAPDRTQIIGNFQRTYGGSPPSCENYPWFVRTFNKPHHEIENDPEVWRAAALLVEAEISARDQVQAGASPESSINSRQFPDRPSILGKLQAMSAEGPSSIR